VLLCVVGTPIRSNGQNGSQNAAVAGVTPAGGGADGVPAGRFVRYAKRMLALLDDTVVGLADDVDRGERDGAEDNLTMELSFLDQLVQTSQNRGLDPSVIIDILRHPGVDRRRA
jgi:hypothetical protein